MDLATDIAKKLLEINAIKLNPGEPFTWASGMKSPIYCDNRIALSHPDVRTFVKENLAEIADSFGDFDTVAGVATAGIAHGALIADLLQKPFIYVRSTAKGHGRKNLIEGQLEKGATVVVVEDLISTGMSSLKAVDALREVDAIVIGVVAIFDYGFPKAKEAFKMAQCPYKTLSNYNALLSEAVNSGYITQEEENILKIWNQDPEAWAKKNT